MKAILIDPRKNEVTEIEITNKEAGQLKAFQELVGGYIEALRCFGNTYHDDVIYMNEEGAINGMAFGFQIVNPPVKAWHMQVIKGAGVVVGSDGQGGTIAPKSTLEQIKKMVVMYDLTDVAAEDAERIIPEPDLSVKVTNDLD